MAKLKEGDECQVKGNNYMWCQIRKILPKGSHGRKCVLAECVCVANYARGDYSYGLIKTFRLVDLKAPNVKVSSGARGSEKSAAGGPSAAP